MAYFSLKSLTWRSMAFHGVPWRVMAFHGIPWLSMAYFRETGILVIFEHDCFEKFIF